MFSLNGSLFNLVNNKLILMAVAVNATGAATGCSNFGLYSSIILLNMFNVEMIISSFSF